MKNAHAYDDAGMVNREITLVALESDGQLGPELRLTALDASTYQYFASRIGQEVSLGVVRAKKL